MHRSIRAAYRSGARVVTALVGAGAILAAVAAPAAAEDISYVSAIPLLQDPTDGGVGVTTVCVGQRTVGGPTVEQAAEVCIKRNGDKIWATVAYGLKNGTVRVSLDVQAYRCRESDNYCVVIDDTGVVTGTATGPETVGVHTTPLTQTWAGRYYKACGTAAVNNGFKLDVCAQPVS